MSGNTNNEKSLAYPLDGTNNLSLYAETAETITWQGYPALCLNGLALLPDLQMQDGRVEVWIGADGPAYPGVAFRVQDPQNFELAYAQPHTSGSWDALQYDPVMNGSNTWQMFHGKPYQKAVETPMGRWFKLRVDFEGQRAAIWVDNQKALVVQRLAHTVQPGKVGIWTYLPAYFRDIQVSMRPQLPETAGDKPLQPRGVVMRWEADSIGPLDCEPGGYLNLNRYLPITAGWVTLRKRFTSAQTEKLNLEFGFSDELALSLDGQEIYTGQNLFKPSPEWKERGYVDIDTARVTLDISEGEHELAARIRATEYFGWGLILSIGIE